MKIINVVGARPNFVKIAPIMAAYKQQPTIKPLLVHTGQHYDEKMNKLFFKQLDIPKPQINLGVGSASHAVQTAQIMKAFEAVALEEKPDAVLVVGDVNSTIACGLVAVKLGVKLVHVEAGLRSFDRTMPEEINRVLTDAISDLLFCTEQSGVDNLRREGLNAKKIFLVGNVMIDTLMVNRAKADHSQILERLGLTASGYAALTLHRPSNVDGAVTFSKFLDALEVVQRRLPIVFPVHPRTRKNIWKLGFANRIESMCNVMMIEPLGYLDFLKLISEAKLVLTDSGGIQEETTILKVPCVTVRENTERPVTVEVGSNMLAGTDPQRIVAGCESAICNKVRTPEIPPLWDGCAAHRIVTILCEELG